MAGLKEFKEKLAQDAALAAEVKKCKNYDELIAFAAENGFSFTDEEIEALTDVAPEELAKAAGGFFEWLVAPEPSGEVQTGTKILVSGCRF